MDPKSLANLTFYYLTGLISKQNYLLGLSDYNEVRANQIEATCQNREKGAKVAAKLRKKAIKLREEAKQLGMTDLYFINKAAPK